MKLYDIPFEAAVIERALVENEGELTPELEAQINNLLTAGQDKIEAAAMVIRNLEADAEACHEEAQRLRDRECSIVRNIDRLKGMVVTALDAAFNGKVKTAKFTVYAQTSAPTLAIEAAPDADLMEIAKQAPWAVRIKPELCKKEIQERIKGGDEIPNGLMVEERPGTRFLRIR